MKTPNQELFDELREKLEKTMFHLLKATNHPLSKPAEDISNPELIEKMIFETIRYKYVKKINFDSEKELPEVDMLYLLKDEDWESIYAVLVELESSAVTGNLVLKMRTSMENTVRILCGRRNVPHSVHDVITKVLKTHRNLPISAKKALNIVHEHFKTSFEDYEENVMSSAPIVLGIKSKIPADKCTQIAKL